MKLLVVGVENPLGKKILPILNQRKHDLWIVIADGTHQAMYQQMGLRVIVGDISENGRWIDTVPSDLDAIINLTIPDIKKRMSIKAIENDIQPKMLRIGQNLAYIVTNRKAGRIIQLANIFYYSQRGTNELSERAPRDIAPENYGLLYSSLISHLLNQKEIQSTICVTGHCMYDSDGTTIPEIPRVMSKSLAVCGTGDNEIHLSHIDDVVGGIVHIVENDLREKVVNIVDNKPLTQKDFIQLLSHVHRIGSPLPLPLQLATFTFGDAYAKSITQSIALKNNYLKESGYWLKYPDYTAGFATHLLR